MPLITKEDDRAGLRRIQSELAILDADRKKVLREEAAIENILRRIKREQAMLQAELSVQTKKKSDIARKILQIDAEIKRLKKMINNR